MEMTAEQQDLLDKLIAVFEPYLTIYERASGLTIGVMIMTPDHRRLSWDGQRFDAFQDQQI